MISLHWEHEQIRDEADACAIIARVKKDGVPSHGNVKRTLEALDRMGHRTGEIEHEGDGTGIQTDIPRLIWERILASNGLNVSLANNPYFTIGHFMIRSSTAADLATIVERLVGVVQGLGIDVVLHRRANTRREFLGPRARSTEPVFYQFACLPARYGTLPDEKTLEATLAIERQLPSVHVVSFSKNTVIYKVRGDVLTLMRYFPELRHPDFKSAISLGHGRYSTNTDSTPERAQMFSTLGHNGEINTIQRLQREARLLGFQLVAGGSDSQHLDRIIESLMFVYGFTLMEAMEIVFPPVWSEVERLPSRYHDMYRFYRRAFGPLAQGPAAVIARQGDQIVFSADALGLRPLWCGETDKEFFASSEKGVVKLESMQIDPKPLAPGEKMGFLLHRPHLDVAAEVSVRPGGVEVFDYSALQESAYQRYCQRIGKGRGNENLLDCTDAPLARRQPAAKVRLPESVYAAFGWLRDDAEICELMASTGKEPIGATGYDGPLPCLSEDVRNLSEWFKERVAVVTNPAIDRVREEEHFSTECFLGRRPSPAGEPGMPVQVRLELPILLDLSDGKTTYLRPIARQFGTLTYTDLRRLSRRAEELTMTILRLSFGPGESLRHALERLKHQAEQAAMACDSGLIVLDDNDIFERSDQLLIDPHLGLAVVNNHLEAQFARGSSLRRKVALVLRSGAVRNVHDIVVALGLGADAVVPYLMIQRAVESAPEEAPAAAGRLLAALKSGVEKVLSTMGIHELAGYGKLFASIGFAHELAELFQVINYLGGTDSGKRLEDVEKDARRRLVMLHKDGIRTPHEVHIYPKVWKIAGDVANSSKDYAEFESRELRVEERTPVSLRHCFDLILAEASVSPSAVDLRVGPHAAPFYISAMSFGSQGEVAYRAYAEAAHRLKIICMNGEGGEVDDLMGRYYETRGQQVASGRFGVNARMLNSTRYLEIKIGQGAKPGEGGQLPGFKVTPQIAAARRTVPGIDLISPSNNHDIYSIEDLAQLIDELKTINPEARVSVKIPSIPNIGPVATGIAKAGADILTISGYDGGTGAARRHALKYVGFPVEIGLKEAHQHLLAAGLRQRVELWADGGMKSAVDVLKMLLLGADRVGFASMAMVAIGCTMCRDCNLGTCHVGITAHFRSEQEALQAGLRVYQPRDYDQAVERLCTFFAALGDSLRQWVGRMGAQRAAELVGRCDLLRHARKMGCFNPEMLLQRPPLTIVRQDDTNHRREAVVLRRPLTSLTRMIGHSVARSIDAGHREVVYEDEAVFNSDRAIGTHLAGEIARRVGNGGVNEFRRGRIKLGCGVVPGNGLGAFTTDPIEIEVEGGTQDGTAKCADGGRVVVLKGENHDGVLVDGSVGKCFAYGAQRGMFIVQGNADSRAGIRLSGADVIIGGEVTVPLQDHLGNIGSRANIKGFGFEYMTSGRGLVLGDPGPWLCSGMSGGVVYFRIDASVGLTIEAIRRRLARNAPVKIVPVDETDADNLEELLTIYRDALRTGHQLEEAERIEQLLRDWRRSFVKAVAGTTWNARLIFKDLKSKSRRKSDK